MQIQKVDSTSNNFAPNAPKNNKNTSFKSLGVNFLALSGSLMQGIENAGYVASFLIQDGLGMTAPRVYTGFHRDKEITGKYNIKEGFEVLGREGMTGPFMMSIAPLTLALAGKFCKSANTNTRLIKIMGRNLKNMFENKKFSEEAVADKTLLLKEFNKYTLEKLYKDTIPEDKKSKEAIEYITNEFDKYVAGDKKALENVLQKLNDGMLTSTSKLNNLCKLKDVADGQTKVFDASSVLRALKDFGHDAITTNKDFDKLNPDAVENIKNNLATKRLMLNISNVALTLGGLSVLPKLYARNAVAPGSEAFAQMQKEQNKNREESSTNATEVTFNGRGINNDGILSKIGKFLTSKVPEWIQKEFEYNGYNFTSSLMACLSLFGLLLPRGIHAYNRAVVDEKTGKKDLTELNEILIRDSISSLSVVYTVPILTKWIVNAYEKKQGFILTNRAAKDVSKWQRFVDLINPYGKFNVFSNAELKALYGNIDSIDKMIHFCEFISEQRGDMGIMLSKADGPEKIFNEKTFTLESLKQMNKNDKNKKITEFFKDFKKYAKTLTGKDDVATQNKLIKELMQNSDNIAKSKLSTIARGLNSVPGLIATFILSPFILGYLIPQLTYVKTRKDHEKMLKNHKTNNQMVA